jgi:hypothetical protein
LIIVVRGATCRQGEGRPQGGEFGKNEEIVIHDLMAGVCAFSGFQIVLAGRNSVPSSSILPWGVHPIPLAYRVGEDAKTPWNIGSNKNDECACLRPVSPVNQQRGSLVKKSGLLGNVN